MKNKFTIEQLEKIIGEMPVNACFYYDGNYAGIFHNIIGGKGGYLVGSGYKLTDLASQLQEMKVMKRPMIIEFKTDSKTAQPLHDAVWDSKLFRVIEAKSDTVNNKSTVKMQEFIIEDYPDNSDKSLKAEFNNTAQQVESLAGSALTMSEFGIEDAVEWKSGDKCVYKCHEGVVIGWHPEQPMIVIETTEHGILCATFVELSKPLTPAQKQQKIDEQNGELYYELVLDLARRNNMSNEKQWRDTPVDYKNLCVDIAKQIDFKGKLESI